MLSLLLPEYTFYVSVEMAYIFLQHLASCPKQKDFNLSYIVLNTKQDTIVDYIFIWYYACKSCIKFYCILIIIIMKSNAIWHFVLSWLLIKSP